MLGKLVRGHGLLAMYGYVHSKVKLTRIQLKNVPKRGNG
jgi:hypothetical protein